MVDDTSGKRNFRVSYYDKVGCRGIGEKAIVAILKDDIIDRKNLENFCIRFSIPSSFRILIWKILLKILPIHQQSHKFVMLQRTEQYNDLNRALTVMRKIDDNTDLPEVFLKMHLLETGELRLTFRHTAWHDNFCSIAQAVSEIVDSPVIGYWVSVKLYHYFEGNNYLAQIDELNNLLTSALKKEHSKLFHHLNDLNFFNDDLIKSWYKRCFAGIIQCNGCLERIWDVLIGRGSRILPYIAVQILITFDRHLLQAKTLLKCHETLTEVPFSDEASDVIVYKGIERWKKLEKIL